MKRVNDVYYKIYDKENIRLAILNAQKGKKHYTEVQIVNDNIEHYIEELHGMLKTKTYKTSAYDVFIKNDKGKTREIFKLPFFPDRVCHWAIIQVVEPFFLNKLNHCTHSAIPGRGIHSAFKQVDGYLRKDMDGTKYCLKMDIKKFYPSIDQDILKSMYRTIFKDEDLLWLLDEIIESTDSGVPIGNYLSQYSGNLYLYKFDRWIKEELKIQYYIRYMDDLVFFHHDKTFLHNLKTQIETYLRDNLKLELKSNWQVFPTRVRGVDFVGYRHFGDYVLLRKSICKNFKRTCNKAWKHYEKHGQITEHQFCSLNSYRGWLKNSNSHRLYLKYLYPLEKPMREHIERRTVNEDNEKCTVL